MRQGFIGKVLLRIGKVPSVLPSRLNNEMLCQLVRNRPGRIATTRHREGWRSPAIKIAAELRMLQLYLERVRDDLGGTSIF